jgi:hypothetical protein
MKKKWDELHNLASKVVIAYDSRENLTKIQIEGYQTSRRKIMKEIQTLQEDLLSNMGSELLRDVPAIKQ